MQNRMVFVNNLTTNETFLKEFTDCLIDFSNKYETQNVLYSFANDFAFNDANNSFDMMDDIISILYNVTDAFIFKYSTPSTYYQDVMQERIDKKLAMQIFHDDFFPIE